MANPAHKSRWGERNPNAKLTADEVRGIRADYKPGVFGQRRVARKYGRSLGCIQGVLYGFNWSHIP